MKKILSLALFLAGTLVASAQEPISVQMVKSEITRNPEARTIDYNTQLKWNYTHGLLMQSMQMTAEQYPSIAPSVDSYITQYLDSIIRPDGSINKYKKTNYTLDHINPGKMLIRAYEKSHDPRLKTALDTLYSQLLSHPRVSEGGFWHKKAYPHQMWLDGIYMEAPFYAEYAMRYLDGAEQEAAFRDVTNQIMVVARHTYDPQNGLYRHAWDESHEQRWCNPENGQAPHVWGRALGWYTMAMVDVLDFMEQTDKPYIPALQDSILSILRPLCRQLSLIQEPTSGAWYQVLDQGQRNGNYLETSCTAMFAYTMIKAAQHGWISQEYMACGKKAYDGLNRLFVRHDEDGTISLTRVCGVAGLGGSPVYRDGTYNYYINEIIRDNDPKGVGPFIMTSLLIESEKQ